jgi:acetyl esterase/lipase
MQPAAFIPSAVDTSKYTVEANLPYDTHPATVVDMLYPKGMKKNDPTAKKYPGVVMFHGGGWIRTSKSTMSTFYNRYLAHGFVVCNAEYRMADPTGQFSPEFAPAPAAVNDALKAAKWFYDHADEYNVDKNRIVVTGASAGGHLALMVGMATPEANLGPTAPQDFKIAAIVDGYGPTDVSDLLTRGTSWAKQWLPENTPNRDALAKRLSPVTYARKDMPPLIIVHGSRDTTVPVPQAEKLQKLLEEKGADSTLHLVEGAGHGYQSPPTAWPDAEKATFEFLAKKGVLEGK